MATLSELVSLYEDGELIKKVSAALVINAHAILESATPSVAQKAWAAKVFKDPHTEAHRVLKAVLADNASATISQIQAATDTQIQTAVDNAASLFIDADAGV